MLYAEAFIGPSPQMLFLNLREWNRQKKKTHSFDAELLNFASAGLGQSQFW